MDLNTIVHLALHNNSDEHLLKMSQADQFHEVWRKICADIDGVVKTVRPQKLLYLALDGCTPRAKMYD
jgi:5'-3' exonuclease